MAQTGHKKARKGCKFTKLNRLNSHLFVIYQPFLLSPLVMRLNNFLEGDH